MDLQAVAELSMEGRKGAVVALDPRNGEVLAMVSRPSFDPGMFEGHIRQQDWNDVVNDPDTPLLQSRHSSAVRAGFDLQADRGAGRPGNRRAGAQHHLSIAPATRPFTARLTNATRCTAPSTCIRRSSNPATCISTTWAIASASTPSREYAQMAGFGKKTGIDLPDEAEGMMPSTKWKLRTQREKWYAGETISVAIGQGQVLVTPIQLAVAMGGLAMGGVWYKPHLVRDAAAADQPRRGELQAENIATIVSAMNGVVSEEGTGASARISGIDVCGKTGSAQRISNTLAKANKALASENEGQRLVRGLRSLRPS